MNEYRLQLHLHLSRSLADRWCTTGDFTNNFLHSSRFSVLRSMMFHSRPIYSLMLSSHRFLCVRNRDRTGDRDRQTDRQRQSTGREVKTSCSPTKTNRHLGRIQQRRYCHVLAISRQRPTLMYHRGKRCRYGNQESIEDIRIPVQK